MRNASDVEGGFPYKSKHICYIELTNNKELRQIPNYKKDKQEIDYRVKNKDSKLYAVWPGTILVICLKLMILNYTDKSLSKI